MEHFWDKSGGHSHTCLKCTFCTIPIYWFNKPSIKLRFGICAIYFEKLGTQKSNTSEFDILFVANKKGHTKQVVRHPLQQRMQGRLVGWIFFQSIQVLRSGKHIIIHSDLFHVFIMNLIEPRVFLHSVRLGK